MPTTCWNCSPSKETNMLSKDYVCSKRGTPAILWNCLLVQLHKSHADFEKL
jgi:hypothetical protein